MKKLGFQKSRLRTNAQVTDRTQQKEEVKNVRPKSIMESFEHIVELAEGSNLGKEFLENANAHIKYASRKLKLTAMQVVLLAIFVDRSEDCQIMLSEIAGYIGCRTTKILRLSAEIDVLESKHYVRGHRSRSGLTYRVPEGVIEALRKNQPFVYEREVVLDTSSFFYQFNRLMREKIRRVDA